MGMAASQARLLTLTSRLHDVEYKAQNVMNQKIALSTQKDELYQEYCDALDATKIQVAYMNNDGTTSFVDANFSTLCGYNPNRTKNYSLIDSKTGKVYVTEETENIYNEFSNSDKYSFAWAMIGMGRSFSYDDTDLSLGAYGQGTEIGVGKLQDSIDYGDGENNLFMTDAERYAFANHSDKVTAEYDALQEALEGDDTDLQKEALQTFRDALYNNAEIRKDIYEYMRRDKQAPQDPPEYDETFPEDFPLDEFNFYANLFEEIQSKGGCTSVPPQCESGDNGNSWFNNMVETGRIIIEYFDGKDWTQTSVATSTNTNMLVEVQDDANLKKAEAEYEYELDKINDKDTKYDQDLSKLETERSSITTEMDSIKKVRDDNVERTFGIFS